MVARRNGVRRRNGPDKVRGCTASGGGSSARPPAGVCSFLKRCNMLFFFPIRTGEWHGRSCCCRREGGVMDGLSSAPRYIYRPFPAPRPLPPSAPTSSDRTNPNRTSTSLPNTPVNISLPTPHNRHTVSKYSYPLHPTCPHSSSQSLYLATLPPQFSGLPRLHTQCLALPLSHSSPPTLLPRFL